MRPELNQRFCGRCGEPCGGYEEPAPALDPPRKCAECAIDAGVFNCCLCWLAALAGFPVALLASLLYWGFCLMAFGSPRGLLAERLEIWRFLLITVIFALVWTIPIRAVNGIARRRRRIELIRRIDANPVPMVIDPASPLHREGQGSA